MLLLALAAAAVAPPDESHAKMQRAACLAAASSLVLDQAHGKLTGNPMWQDPEPLSTCTRVGGHPSQSNIAKWEAFVCVGAGACAKAYVPALVVGYPGSDPNNAADWNINRNLGCEHGWCDLKGPIAGAYSPLTVLGPAGQPRPLHVDAPGTLGFFVDGGFVGTPDFRLALEEALKRHRELSLVLAGYSSGASAAAYAAMRLLETGRVPRLERLEDCASGGLCVFLEGPYWQHSAGFTDAFVRSGGYAATTTKCEAELDFPMRDTTFATEAEHNLHVAGTAWSVLNVTELDACPAHGYPLHFPATYAKCQYSLASYGRNGTEVQCNYAGEKLKPPPPVSGSGAGVVQTVLEWSKNLAPVVQEPKPALVEVRGRGLLRPRRSRP